MHKANRAVGPGGVEIVGYSSFTAATLPFLEATAAGGRGLVVLPSALADRMHRLLENRPVVLRRLGESAGGGELGLADLPAITAAVAEALKAEEPCDVYLDGVDRLIALHGTASVATALSEIDRRAQAVGARVWVHLPESGLPAGERERFRQLFPGRGAPKTPEPPADGLPLAR